MSLARDLIRILLLIASASILFAYELSSPSSQPKLSAEESPLTAVSGFPDQVLVLQRRSQLPKTHAKRNLAREHCRICKGAFAANADTESLGENCGHVFHPLCAKQWRTSLLAEDKPLECPGCVSSLHCFGVGCPKCKGSSYFPSVTSATACSHCGEDFDETITSQLASMQSYKSKNQ